MEEVLELHIVGFLLGLVLFVATYIGFPILFGETPVNVLNISSTNGLKNLILNLLFYSLITLGLSTLPVFFLPNRARWYKFVIFGVCLSFLLSILFSLLLTHEL